MKLNISMRGWSLIINIVICCLVSCEAKDLAPSIYLLPKPQQLMMTKAGEYTLERKGGGASTIVETLVKDIPEAVVNKEEAYRLEITADSIFIEAITEKGIYWARQTLEQIIASFDGTIPTLQIVDYPAFRIRGFMHDVGRSFISVAELKRQIALLSKFKINVFHWHLTENQGWRLESKVYPQLNDSANFERLAGQYYTIAEAREIARFCKEHNMLLIPEIDMPGHSQAFVRAMGVDMQSKEGMEILKKLMTEIIEEVFPNEPYIHIGTDEVAFTNSKFVPEMVAFIRSKGKKVISWNPGWHYKVGEIDMTQLWSYRGKAQPGIPAIDSRFYYINHFDTFGDIIALYNSRIANVEVGNDDIAGAIIGVWNDRVLTDEKQILLQNNFYPNMLALAERSWLGGGSEYFDKNGTILPIDENNDILKAFINFEDRMLWYKEYLFAQEPFAYVKQTNVKWRVTEAFPNEGELTRSFPPEDALKLSYEYDGKIYKTKEAVGAGVYLRHVWGELVPTFYKNPKKNHTAYAYTWVWSPVEQQVGLWATTQDYSRSEKDLAPPQGKWDYRESKIFINDEAISPPVWENNHTELTHEVSLKNENFTARLPIVVTLKRGWNKVLLKLPVAGFSTREVRLQKWMFNFVFVTLDGKNAVKGLVYSPDKIKE